MVFVTTAVTLLVLIAILMGMGRRPSIGKKRLPVGGWLADHRIPIAIAAAMFCATTACAGEVLLTANHNGYWMLHLFLVWSAGNILAWLLLNSFPPLMLAIPAMYACGLALIYGTARRRLFKIGESESGRVKVRFVELGEEDARDAVKGSILLRTAVCNLIGGCTAGPLMIWMCLMAFMASWSPTPLSDALGHANYLSAGVIASIISFACQCYGFKKIDEVFEFGLYGNPKSDFAKLLRAAHYLPSEESAPPRTELQPSWICPRCGEERDGGICPVCGAPCMERYIPGSPSADSIQGAERLRPR